MVEKGGSKWEEKNTEERKNTERKETQGGGGT